MVTSSYCYFLFVCREYTMESESWTGKFTKGHLFYNTWYESLEIFLMQTVTGPSVVLVTDGGN